MPYFSELLFSSENSLPDTFKNNFESDALLVVFFAWFALQ
jgi:hypothetical protein